MTRTVSLSLSFSSSSMTSPWKSGCSKPRTISCTGPMAMAFLSLVQRESGARVVRHLERHLLALAPLEARLVARARLDRIRRPADHVGKRADQRQGDDYGQPDSPRATVHLPLRDVGQRGTPQEHQHE